MKNLKKILIALSVIALLVSSFALIVGAEGEYTGTVEKLWRKYASIDVNASAESQVKALNEAYKMLQENTFDPNGTYVETVVNDDPDTAEDETVKVTHTYAETVTLINESSVRIGELLYSNIADAVGSAKLSAVGALLNLLATCPPAEGTAGYADLLTKANAKNVEVIAERLAAVKELELAEAKKAVVEIYNHISNYSVDETANAQLLADIDAFAYDVAAQLYADWETIPADHVDAEGDNVCDYCAGAMDSSTSAHYHARYNGIYAAKYYIASVKMFANGSVVSGLPAGAETAAKGIVRGCNTMDAEKSAKQLELDSHASFDDYDIGGPYLEYDCESSLLPSHNPSSISYAVVDTDIYGNKYQNFIKSNDSTHLYTEPSPGAKNAYQLGMIIEFDMLVDDNFKYSNFQWREPSVNMGTFLTIRSNDGVITIKNSPYAGTNIGVQSVAGAIVPNVWARITLTYNDETRLGKVYVNYEFVCDISFSSGNKFYGLRMGPDGGTTNNNIGYDNFTVINGTEYRIWNKFAGWSDAQLFNYYVEVMSSEENDSLTRNSAYKKAKLLFSNVENLDACQGSVATYKACDYDNAIKKPAMAANLALLKEEVDELLALEVNSDNIDKINEKIAEINEFISKNSELINKGDTSEGGYQSLMMEVNTVKANLIKIDNVKAFVDALKKFNRATTLVSMSKYAATAEAIYVLAAYEIPENVAFVENDPAVLAFEKLLNGEIEPEDETYVTLFEYYETVAEKIAVRTLYENSKKIISCMDLVTSIEGYEATAEFWADNADQITTYVTIARDALNGSYDDTVEGIDEAIATFRTLDVFFYELLQQQHITVLEEQLAKYVATEAYIDKVGVCAVVKQYLDENDIAVYNTDMTPEVAAAVADEAAKLSELIIIYNVYNDELELQKEDYEAVLAQNTQYFINTINTMTATLGYSELKPLFEKATGYYYSIDADGEAAAAAAEKYVAYREQLEAWEANGAIFVGYVDGLAEAKALSGVEREDAVYAILVSCMAYKDIVDVGVDGVVDAMAEYEQELADYNAELNVVNADINESAKFTCAVRTRSISNVVLAIVSKIFEN